MTRWRAKLAQSAKNRADPQVVADAVAGILENPKPKLRYVVGHDARMTLMMRRLLPAGLFERIVVKMSGMDV